jgi:hypothetical protein
MHTACRNTDKDDDDDDGVDTNDDGDVTHSQLKLLGG